MEEERGGGIRPSRSTHHHSSDAGGGEGLSALPPLTAKPRTFKKMSNEKEIKGINKSDFIELSWGDALGVGDLLVLVPCPQLSSK